MGLLHEGAVVAVNHTCIIWLSCDCIISTSQASSLCVLDSAKVVLCHLLCPLFSWTGGWQPELEGIQCGGLCFFADDIVLFHQAVTSAMIWSSLLFKEVGLKISMSKSEAAVLLCKNVYWFMKWNTKLAVGSVQWQCSCGHWKTILIRVSAGIISLSTL